MSSSVELESFGNWRGVSLEVAPWDTGHAQVDLSAACMFTHELDSTGIKGGLLHLDQALGGRLTALRRSGSFKAKFMETLLVSTPPTGVQAKSLLIVGLGTPSAWTADITAHAVSVAVRTAVQRGDRSMAFAPSLLDSGLNPERTVDITRGMVKAVIDTIEAQLRIAECGLANAPVLCRVVFDVGASRIDMTRESFRDSFQIVAAYVPATGENEPPSDKREEQ
ncbi:MULTISPECIES: M17 family peptidase N-terminal domain-containing protein [unclassified Rhizobium]|uniref:M17 family peptidase N-terminal domain-containing protein n=1 Tax=Rhizobium TaxID=379 RepID=UPI0009F6873C|nr:MULTISPECIES: M17 family peptidase N-terminal domain-containing protein [unclassified Rhizobium]QYA15952.1 hypothetical protein J5284_28585 [Rhizobium sp. AB2/73]UEQ84495.1 hypothetical protein I8E17_29915 [Rhizobium sp. AB2/73]